MDSITKCLVIFSFATVSAVDVKPNGGQTRSKLKLIDLIEADVKREDWSADMVCYEKLMATFENARNFTLWATWNSTQLPVGALYGSKYHLGNYDECLKPAWESNLGLETKYCLADVRLTTTAPSKWKGQLDARSSTEEYIKTLTKHVRDLTTITWGVCVPAACQPQSVSKLFRILLRSSHLHPMAENAVITVERCEEAGRVYEYPLGVTVFWYLLIALFATALLSTYYVAKRQNTNKDNLVSKIAKSFCMKRNALDLVRSYKDDIPVLYGIRALTAMIFTFSHHLYFMVSGPIINGLDVDEHIDFGSIVMHSDLLTDTFLVMSGMLLAKGLMDKWDKPENMFISLWKRYLRLLPPIALIVFYMSSVSVHAGNGPVWHKLAGRESLMCQKTGWITLLMLNNYIRSEEMCYIILWYIPTDFQLTIMGMVLFYIYRNHRRMGLVVIFCVSVTALVLPGLVTYLYELPATIIYNIEVMIDIRSDVVFNEIYIKSHYRATSYLIGMGFGYLLSVYKPVHFRKVISKKTSVISFVIIFITACSTMAIGGVFYTREYNAIEAAVYAASNRVVWVLCICALISICEYGELSLINSFLSWSAFVPLSRLSYGLYLVHGAVLQRNAYAARAPLRQDIFTMFTNSLGVAVFSFLLSLVMWLLIQAPVAGLVNVFMNSSKTGSSNKVQEDTKEQSNMVENSLCKKEL